MTSTVPAVDLRVRPVDDVLDHVERSLQTRLDRATVIRKRRTVGARTDRNTWVRVERRAFSKINDQGWNGAECAALLTGVAQPAWHGSVTWREVDAEVMWRADETELLPDEPIGTSVLAMDPQLPDGWWSALNSTLDALATQRTRRLATPDTVTVTQELVTSTIHQALPDVGEVVLDDDWRPAHADLNWANMTQPRFCLFDWEDWGTAPRGLDAASLWGNSLAVPDLADRVRRERRQDLESRSGKLMTLFVCAKILGPDAHPDDPRLGAARAMATRTIRDLHADHELSVQQ